MLSARLGSGRTLSTQRVRAFRSELPAITRTPCFQKQGPAGPARSPALVSKTCSTLQQRLTTCNVGRREGVFFFGFGDNDEEDDDEEYTVCKLQVGLFGDINKWQARLNKIATQHDTIDEDGLHQVYTDALMLVLRNLEYAGYACSAGKAFDDLDDAEQKFNSVLMEERVKFKEETLSNVNGRRKSSSLEAKGADVGLDRWLCMTMLMAVEGKVKLPKISSASELKQVLTSLGGITADNLVAFELLWTPQETDDSYSKDELLADYPNMFTLS